MPVTPFGPILVSTGASLDGVGDVPGLDRPVQRLLRLHEARSIRCRAGVERREREERGELGIVVARVDRRSGEAERLERAAELAGEAVGVGALHEGEPGDAGQQRQHEGAAEELPRSSPVARRRSRSSRPRRSASAARSSSRRATLASRKRRSAGFSTRPVVDAHAAAWSSRDPRRSHSPSSAATRHSAAAAAQPAVLADVVPALVDPTPQPRPLREERLVGDLDGGLPRGTGHGRS